jgi:hypothetical protein
MICLPSSLGSTSIFPRLAVSLIIRSIEETWKSKEMEYFREIHRNGEFWKHPVCKKCVLSTSHFDVQDNL